MRNIIDLQSNNTCDFLKINNTNVLSVSYCYENVLNTDVPIYQKKVFDKFDMKLNQFYGNIRHSEFMDYIITNVDFDIYIFFDMDCIPLKNGLYEYIINKIQHNGIIGIEQCAGIANESPEHIYAGPACFSISKNVYNNISKPSFKENRRSDVAQEFTHVCESNNIPVYFFKLTKCNNYKWKLGCDRYFGNGAIYEDWLYHQFEIKRDNDENKNILEFIEKCKEVL